RSCRGRSRAGRRAPTGARGTTIEVRSMKAARYHGKEDLRVEEVPEPVTQPGTVKIRPAWTGICGSDLHLFLEGPFPPAPSQTQPHPLSGETLPVVFGHEFSGVVEELGEGVEGLAVGDAVVVEPFMVCGECPPCRDGLYNACVKMGFIGISGRGGGLAEHVVVERRWVHPVGDVPLDQAALVEPLAVAYHGVRLSGAKAGDTVLVGGAGPIGLLTCAVLHAIGARAVVTEVSGARKAKALETGVADVVLDPREVDVAARVLELTDGRGADVAIECSGAQPVLDTLTRALKAGGTLQIVALFSEPPTLDVMTVLLRELTIKGAIGYADDHPAAIRLVQDGKVDLAPFVTGRIAVEDVVEKGYRELIDHKDDHVKIVVSV